MLTLAVIKCALITGYRISIPVLCIYFLLLASQISLIAYLFDFDPNVFICPSHTITTLSSINLTALSRTPPLCQFFDWVAMNSLRGAAYTTVRAVETCFLFLIVVI